MYLSLFFSPFNISLVARRLEIGISVRWREEHYTRYPITPSTLGCSLCNKIATKYWEAVYFAFSCFP